MTASFLHGYPLESILDNPAEGVWQGVRMDVPWYSISIFRRHLVLWFVIPWPGLGWSCIADVMGNLFRLWPAGVIGEQDGSSPERMSDRVFEFRLPRKRLHRNNGIRERAWRFRHECDRSEPRIGAFSGSWAESACERPEWGHGLLHQAGGIRPWKVKFGMALRHGTVSFSIPVRYASHADFGNLSLFSSMGGCLCRPHGWMVPRIASQVTSMPCLVHERLVHAW